MNFVNINLIYACVYRHVFFHNKIIHKKDLALSLYRNEI